MILPGVERHANEILAAVAGSAATFGLGRLAVGGLRYLSGASEISDNTGNITRAAEDYASQMGLDIAKLKAAPIDLTNVDSLFVANAETAAIVMHNAGTVTRHSVRLYDAGGLARLHAALAEKDPARIFAIFGGKPVSSSGAAELQKEDWVRPAFRKRFLALLGGDAQFDARATQIREALDLTAKVLAASPEANITLSGACHVALKTTDLETGKVGIEVRPANKHETKMITWMETDMSILPVEGEHPAVTLRDRLLSYARATQPRAYGQGG